MWLATFPTGSSPIWSDRFTCAATGREPAAVFASKRGTGARHGNVRGNLHNGMLMTLADQILGFTVTEALGHTSLATVSLNTEFVAGANIGDWLVGRGEISAACGL